MTRTRRLMATVLLFLLATACAGSRLLAHASHSTVRSTEDFDITVSAAEGCSGEDVHIYGPISLVVQTTSDAERRVHMVSHYTPHLVGVGLTTGTSYLPVGPTTIINNNDGSYPATFTLVNLIRLVSAGGKGNLQIVERTHVTINANGDVTVDYSAFDAACRG